MDKFWSWMREKEYGMKRGNGTVLIYPGMQPQKQALIGYMIEYCYDIRVNGMLKLRFNIEKTASMYDALEKIIKEAE